MFANGRLPVFFDDMDTIDDSYATYQLLLLLFLATGHYLLSAVSCALHIVNRSVQSIPPNAQKIRHSGVSLTDRVHPQTSKSSSALKRKSPAQAPRAYRICNTVRICGGPVPGKVSPEEAPEGPAS